MTKGSSPKGNPPAFVTSPQTVSVGDVPLCFCIVCRTINRPRPTRWCTGCGADLVHQEALLRGGIQPLLDAYAPAQLDGHAFAKTLRGDELVRLYSEVFDLWESRSRARPRLWPPDVPPPLPGVPLEVSKALGRLGFLFADVTLDQLHWVYRTLSKMHHPDSGGDPTGARMKRLTAAYETARAWLEQYEVQQRDPTQGAETTSGQRAQTTATTPTTPFEPLRDTVKVRVRTASLRQTGQGSRAANHAQPGHERSTEGYKEDYQAPDRPGEDGARGRRRGGGRPGEHPGMLGGE